MNFFLCNLHLVLNLFEIECWIFWDGNWIFKLFGICFGICLKLRFDFKSEGVSDLKCWFLFPFLRSLTRHTERIEGSKQNQKKIPLIRKMEQFLESWIIFQQVIVLVWPKIFDIPVTSATQCILIAKKIGFSSHRFFYDATKVLLDRSWNSFSFSPNFWPDWLVWTIFAQNYYSFLRAR